MLFFSLICLNIAAVLTNERLWNINKWVNCMLLLNMKIHIQIYDNVIYLLFFSSFIHCLTFNFCLQYVSFMDWSQKTKKNDTITFIYSWTVVINHSYQWILFIGRFLCFDIFSIRKNKIIFGWKFEIRYCYWSFIHTYVLISIYLNNSVGGFCSILWISCYEWYM